MEVIRRLAEMTAFAGRAKQSGRKIGLVPTMGYLHEGHLSLVRLLEGACDLKMASIFVNPIQFGPKEDFSRYPRDEARDFELLKASGCEAVFCPTPEEVYPNGFQTYVEVEHLEKYLCGPFRPGHFRGVTTVVLKLFNMTLCDAASFGQKDYQQAMIIKRMVSDLNLPVKLVFGKTLREADGLAMSSRNAYLSEEERKVASFIPKALNAAGEAYKEGERRAATLIELIKRILRGGLVIQYVEIVDAESLEPVERLEGPARAALAVFAGKTRLIDNIALGS